MPTPPIRDSASSPVLAERSPLDALLIELASLVRKIGGLVDAIAQDVRNINTPGAM